MHSTHSQTKLSFESIYLYVAGFVLIRKAPTAPGTLQNVATIFASIRPTNYGLVFDVKQKPQGGTNLADTSLGLSPHTDNPYRNPVPGYQVMHCITPAPSGGESMLVDGFNVAETLRTQFPNHFELLSTHPRSFAYDDPRTNTHLRAEHNVISLSPSGTIQAVHFNNRSAAPLAVSAPMVLPYLSAWHQFEELTLSDAHCVKVWLSSGDVLVLNNQRVLHARAPFSGHGRWLQGCYLQTEDPESRLCALGNLCMIMSLQDVVDEVVSLLEEGEGISYGEYVNMLQHSLQAAAAATRAGMM
jgi:gamma-butyrobetaine dioxygenase